MHKILKIVSPTFLIFVCPTILAATPYHDFTDACTSAFTQSSSASGEKPTAEQIAFGRSLCECTATESKSQKVPIARLKKETAKIKADSKYKLHDPGLLASLQYCSMKATEGLDPDESSSGK